MAHAIKINTQYLLKNSFIIWALFMFDSLAVNAISRQNQQKYYEIATL
jgi:hypothetical protein